MSAAGTGSSPDATDGWRQLLLQAQSSLQQGNGSSAIVQSGRLAERVLKQLLAPAVGKPAMLGDLLRLVAERKLLPAEVSRDLNWLNKLRNREAHDQETVVEADLDDAQKAVQVVTDLLVRCELVDEPTLRTIRRDSLAIVCRPPPDEVLKLDRAPQRRRLDDLATPPPPVLAFLTHGEVGQGHSYFSKWASWHLRSQVRTRWSEVEVPWPAQGPPVGVRFGELCESLAHEVSASFSAPRVDPTSPDGRGAWEQALRPLVSELASSNRCRFLRTVIHAPQADDAQVLSEYLERVWLPVSDRPPGATQALSFEVVRAAAGGFAIVSRAWRIGRSERRAVVRIAQTVEALSGPGPLKAVVLEELGHVPLSDLVEWLQREAGQGRVTAQARARELHAASSGRFEIVAQRLATVVRKRTP